jgi:Acetyltransferases
MNIEYVTADDKEFWFQLDSHISVEEFSDKISRKMGYIIFDNGKRVGLLRFNLFWDNTPFCTMLFVDWNSQGKGYGKKLMEHWENDMRSKGYGMVMTSTQVDENSQHFYRKLGYQDAGGLLMNIPGYEQPMEIFFVKGLW